MAATVRPRRERERRRPPGPLRVRLRRLRRRLLRWLRRRKAGWQAWRRGRKGLAAPTWKGRRLRVRAAKVIAYAGALLMAVWVVRAFVVAIGGEPIDLPFNPDAACSDTGFSCGVVSGVITTVLSLALASMVFLFWRLGHVEHPYANRAEEKPRELVPTAGSIIDQVVGRDELCRVIMDDLRDRESRRPHLIVGGVGAGKTAVLVRLTQMLAEQGAVPVAIRLRDANGGGKLDFRELALKRFVAEVQDDLLSDAEGEKVWRQLTKDDRVVVLADGLEEALIDGPERMDRDNRIRLAIHDAQRQQLPLVIASRPHDPLAGLDAAVIELEPLSEEAALDYISSGGPVDDEHRLHWVIATAQVVEAPLYLQIARELHERHLLEHAYPGGDEGRLDTRGVDRVALRLRLLETWMNGLILGHFHSQVPLNAREREATVEQLAALACVGLAKDSLEVPYEDLTPRDAEKAVQEHQRRRGQSAPGAPTAADLRREQKVVKLRQRPLVEALLARLDALGGVRVDVRLAATRGTSLGLVETRADRVRFPHSIMQAYLGSRLIGAVLDDEPFMREALADPGRELLTAIVMHVHRESGTAAPSARARRGRTAQGPPAPSWEKLRDRLREAAESRTPDAKTLDLMSTVLQIDALDPAPIHEDLTKRLETIWGNVQAEDRTIEDAKLNVTGRFGEVGQRLMERGASEDGAEPTSPDYARIYAIACVEHSYPVRLEAAHVLAAGGDQAFVAIHGDSGRSRRPDPARRVAAALGDLDEQRHRELVMQAWLAPLHVGSVGDDKQDEAREILNAWLRLVDGGRGARARLPLSLECALAQGFKHAANRRKRHPHFRADASEHLAERAVDMLRESSFWYSRLTLLHALCLWALPDQAEPSRPATVRRFARAQGARAAGAGDATTTTIADPEALVRHWGRLPSGQKEHPLVREARDLAIRALETGHPERYIWIDESGVSTKVGSPRSRHDARLGQHLWISASAGWSALDGAAQQLVADVLLLLNLAERGARPADRERRLQRANLNELPPCMTDDRRTLDPSRTVGGATRSPPGSNCREGCPFRLCPYPPKGEQAYRVELSEAFSRRQQTLLDRRIGGQRKAPWQDALPRELKEFWRAMERRAQR